MVLPLLALAAGYGLQAYGSDQKTQAAQNAQTTYNEWLKRNGSTQSAEDRQIEAYLKQLQEKYGTDVANLVAQYQPSDRMNTYAQGEAQQRNGIQTVLDSVNGAHSPYAPTSNGLFANAQAAEGARVTQANQPVVNATAMAGGLNALATRDQRNAVDFSDNARGHNTKILDAMRLYQLGNASRNKALARAGMQNQLDVQNAQSAGNGAMLAGGLISAVGQGYGSYQANQPSSADQSFQSQLNAAAPGGSAYNPGFSQYQGLH